MVTLPAHLVLIVGGLMAVLFSEFTPPVLDLPWWAGLPLFGLAPLAQLARAPLARRMFAGRGWLLAGRGVAALVFLSPLLIELGFLFLTNFREVAIGWSPWVVIPGWPGLETLLLLLPLGLAHVLILARPGERLLPSVTSRTNVRARLALFAWGVIGLYLALSGAVGTSASARIWVEESTFASFSFSLVLLVGLLFAAPRLLLLVFATTPLEGYWRHLGEELSRKLGVRPPQLLEWHTDDEIANAMVLTTPLGPRPVLFTDAFLRRLSFEEFRAVLAHELGHVAGRHVGLLASFVLGAALVGEGLFGAQLEGPWGELVALVFLGLLGLAVGFLSRRIELEADLFAFEATGEVDGLTRALGQVAGRRASRRSWRHFSTTRRSIFLRAAQHDPGVGERLRRGIRIMRHLSIGLLLLGTASVVWGGVASWPVERFWIELRSGHMLDAAERLERLDGEQFSRAGDLGYGRVLARLELERLVALGAELEWAGEPLETGRLGQLAADAYDADQLARAQDLADLALLIADPKASALAASIAGDTRSDTQLESWAPLLAWLRRSP